MTDQQQYQHDALELGERVAWFINEEHLQPTSFWLGLLFDAACA